MQSCMLISKHPSTHGQEETCRHACSSPGTPACTGRRRHAGTHAQLQPPHHVRAGGGMQARMLSSKHPSTHGHEEACRHACSAPSTPVHTCTGDTHAWLT